MTNFLSPLPVSIRKRDAKNKLKKAIFYVSWKISTFVEEIFWGFTKHLITNLTVILAQSSF